MQVCCRPMHPPGMWPPPRSRCSRQLPWPCASAADVDMNHSTCPKACHPAAYCLLTARPLLRAEASGAGSKRKPQFSGGLVLEPVKGLHDACVLLLDFNSLYPSIIQEYNICFTTVERRSGEEGLPPLPDASAERAVLPTVGPVQPGLHGGAHTSLDWLHPSLTLHACSLARVRTAAPAEQVPAQACHAGLAWPTQAWPQVIASLVARRREARRLLAGERDATRAAQLNIRQQALKLTANSMYGCLGFANSRFLARPLAELVTAQGRHILQATVDLVQGSLGAQVRHNLQVPCTHVCASCCTPCVPRQRWACQAHVRSRSAAGIACCSSDSRAGDCERVPVCAA